MLFNLLLTAFAPLCARAQALAEPAGLNNIYFGAWVQTGHGDSFRGYNERVGYNQSIFQIAVDMPQSPYNYTTGAGGPPPEYQIEQTETSAIVYLTVYPQTFALRDADFRTLSNQLKNWTEEYNRTVFLRFAPEMQGTWFNYGNQPTAYLAMWRQMYTFIKGAAPQTIIVWAPNTGQGYPYGQTFASIESGVNPNLVADTALLDTNGDGVLDWHDDPFGPYYPGDDYVDWIGLSVYYKGSNNLNVALTDNHCDEAFASIDVASNYFGAVDFYQTYCAAKPTKACMFAEAGAAFHRNSSGTPGTASLVSLQSSWLNTCVFNTTFWDSHPRIKAYIHFEWEKVEFDGGVADDRDYRVTNDTALLPIYQAGIQQIASRVQWATYSPAHSDVPTSGRPDFLPGASQASQAVTPHVIFQTQRVRDFSSPTLFGITSGGAVLAVSTVAAVGAGALAVFVRWWTIIG